MSKTSGADMCNHVFIGDVCVKVKNSPSSYTFSLGHCKKCNKQLSDFEIRHLIFFPNASIIYRVMHNYLNGTTDLKETIKTLFKYGKCSIVPLRKNYCYVKSAKSEKSCSPGPIIPMSPIKRFFSFLFGRS